MNLQTLETLRAARALITQGWTQQAMARDAHGVRLIGGTRHPETFEPAAACAWCAWGAICAAAPESSEAGAQDGYKEAARDALRDAVGGWSSVGGWNDKPERTQAEVLAAFDRAILKGERDMLRAALAGLLDGGSWHDDGDFVIPAEEHDGPGDAPDIECVADAYAALAAIPQT